MSLTMRELAGLGDGGILDVFSSIVGGIAAPAITAYQTYATTQLQKKDMKTAQNVAMIQAQQAQEEARLATERQAARQQTIQSAIPYVAGVAGTLVGGLVLLKAVQAIRARKRNPPRRRRRSRGR